MTFSDQMLAQRLGFLGLIPFIAGATGPWVLYDHTAWILKGFHFYSAGMLAFIAGSVWGVRLDYQKTDPGTLIMSVTVALIAIGSLLLPVRPALILLALAFLFLLQWERRNVFPTVAADWYPMLRQRLTWTVVACHMFALFNLWLPPAHG